MEFGAFIGFAIGLVVWWSAYESGAGLFQKAELVVVPAVLGILVVDLRNRRKRVGSYHPNTISRNRKGRP